MLDHGGEPISHGYRRLHDRDHSLREALLAAGIVALVIAVNGVLALLFFELCRALGIWEPAVPVSTDEVMNGLSGWLRQRAPVPA